MCKMLAKLFIFLSTQNVLYGNHVQDYDPINFKRSIEKLSGNFINFHASWCSHSRDFSKIWNNLAKQYNEYSPNIAFGRVDCSLHFKLCHEYDITGYPTLLYFHKSSFAPIEYNKTRDLASLSLFLHEMIKIDPVNENPILIGTKDLNNDNFEKYISEGQHFILFYTPWCRASQRLAPTWSELSMLYLQSEEVNINKVNCMESDMTCKNFDIKQYPYMVWFANGRITGVTNVETLDDLKDYVKRMSLTENHDAEKYMKRKKSHPVTRIVDDTLEPYLEKDLVFVNFIAPWCAHCMQQSPVWFNLGVKYENETRVLIADVDCIRSKQLCQNEKINNLPTLILYRNKIKVKEEHGTQPFDSLVDLIEEHLKDGSSQKSTDKTSTKRDEL